MSLTAVHDLSTLSGRKCGFLIESNLERSSNVQLGSAWNRVGSIHTVGSVELRSSMSWVLSFKALMLCRLALASKCHALFQPAIRQRHC